MTTQTTNSAEGAVPQQGSGLPQFGTVRLTTGVELRYTEQGDPAGPAVILLHGFTDSWFSWRAVLPHLSPTYRVFALDQRGHGDSERPAGGYSMSDFAADVLAFMDATGLPTATLVGHSMGSWVAQRAASLAPERIDRLVLVGTSAAHVPVVEELGEAARTLDDPVPADFIREFQASTIYRSVPEAFFERVVTETGKVPARVWRATISGWLTEARWGDLERLRMPVLILWGDQDTFMPREDQDLLAATLPNPVLAVYAGTGHALHWDEPERFARDLQDFMNSARPALTK